MSTAITFNNVQYNVPAFGDSGYAQGPGNMSAYWIALSTGTFQQSGGNFTLTSDANFGPNFGLIAKYFTSITSTPATAGSIRLAKTDTIDWRNNANSTNLPLGINGSDQLTFNGAVITTGLVTGNLTDVGTDGIVVTGGTGAVLGSGTSLAQHVADASHNGYLSSTDWSTFNGKGAGTVSSVALTVPAFLSVSGSPITTSGTLAVSLSGTALPVANGGTGDTSFTAYSVLCGGITSTGALQNVSGVGTAGQALISNGAGALPTWQNAGSISGTVNSGTANHFSYYATSTNAVSDSGIDITNPTFAGQISAVTEKLTATTNQLILGTTRTVTISAVTPAGSSRTWTIADVSGDATFAAINAAQTFTGTQTFNALALGADMQGGTHQIKNIGTGTVVGDAVAFGQTIAFQNTATQGITGTSTNDSAASGMVGQYVESLVSTGTNYGATTAWVDMTSISLTAGDWDVTLTISNDVKGITTTEIDMGISQTTGNSSTGLVFGSNYLLLALPVGSAVQQTAGCIGSYRQSLSGTTTIYAKARAVYTGTTPTFVCRLSARRVR